MSEPLTREQRIRCIVETLRPTDPDSWEPNILYVTAECDGMDFTLQQQLAEAQQENAKLAQDCIAWARDYRELQQQLAEVTREIEAMTEERDAAEMRELELQRNAILLINKIEALRQQLEAQAWTVSPAMAQAQIDQLTQDQQRLINSNEHWHVRVEQMIREVEQVTREVEQVTQERDAAEMRSVAHLKMYTEASQQLEAMTKERDEMKAYVSRIRLGQELVFIRKQLAMARQQLAAMTQEWDEAVRIATGLIAWAPITDVDVKWAEAKLAAQQHQGGLP